MQNMWMIMRSKLCWMFFVVVMFAHTQSEKSSVNPNMDLFARAFVQEYKDLK